MDRAASVTELQSKLVVPARQCQAAFPDSCHSICSSAVPASRLGEGRDVVEHLAVREAVDGVPREREVPPPSFCYIGVRVLRLPATLRRVPLVSFTA